MANLALKNGIFLIRFRYGSTQYKRSLKTRNRREAEVVKCRVEQTVHLLHMGTPRLPTNVDPGEFIVTGGALRSTPANQSAPEFPTTRSLIDLYLTAKKNTIADTYHYSHTKTETQRQIDLHPELKQHLLDWREQRPKGQLVLCDGATVEPLQVDRANRLFWRPMRGTPWCSNSRRNLFKVGFHTTSCSSRCPTTW